MPKYLLTEDALIVPTSDGILQYAKSLPNFEQIFERVKNADDLDLIKPNINYEDDDVTITHDKNTDNAELFYEGRYYKIDSRLVDIFVKMKSLNDGFHMKYAVKLLLNLINNEDVKFEELVNCLFKNGFVFDQDGNIIMAKHLIDNKFMDLGSKPNKNNNQTLRFDIVRLNPKYIDCKLEAANYQILEQVFYHDRYVALFDGSFVGDVNIILANIISNDFHTTFYRIMASYSNLTMPKHDQYDDLNNLKIIEEAGHYIDDTVEILKSFSRQILKRVDNDILFD